jgi:dTDP-4-amino-4,6-dideoxygalactose transaminase
VFGQEAVAALARVLASGRLTQGPNVEAFEDAVAEYCGTRFAVATTSATTALQLVLAALDIRQGDEVIVPDFTYPATANVVLRQGANVRLVDIDPRTYNVDPDAVAEAISPRTRAVIAVDLFGLPADYTALEPIVADREIPLLCDAACALGGAWESRRCGSIGVAGCFSFHPRKILTTGEGGMVTTDDEHLAERARRLRNHGSERDGWRSVFVEPGFNFRMGELEAALGLVQIAGHDAVIERRRLLAARLTAALADVDGITAPYEPVGGRHAYQAYVTMLDESVDRDRLIALLRDEEIEATLGTYALHAEPAFAEACGTRPGDLPVSFAASSRSLALPLHERLREVDVDRVAGALSVAIAAM